MDYWKLIKQTFWSNKIIDSIMIGSMISIPFTCMMINRHHKSSWINSISFAFVIVPLLMYGHRFSQLKKYETAKIRYSINRKSEIKNRDRIVLCLIAKDGVEVDGIEFENIFKLMDQFNNNGISPIMARVNNVNDIKSIITQLKDEKYYIEYLWFRVHGNPFQFNLGDERIDIKIDGYRNTENFDLLADALNDLPDNTNIILESCSSGRIVKKVMIQDNNVTYEITNPMCIDQRIANQKPGWRVFAPSMDIKYGTSISFNLLSVIFKISHFSFFNRTVNANVFINTDVSTGTT